jgi:hypothetical protein
MTKFNTAKKTRNTPVEEFLANIEKYKSGRRVRPVVTRSGHRATGVFPSIKAPVRGCKYEALVERDFQRILEVSSRVKRVTSHPYVLRLERSDGKKIHYTPDFEVRLEDHAILVEVKGSYFLETYEQRQRLREIIRALDDAQIHYVVVLDSEIQAPGLQDELEDLLHARPVVGRYRPSLNTKPFDPLGRSVSNPELETKWRTAQVECDALLSRLMRRDPGDLLPTEQR